MKPLADLSISEEFRTKKRNLIWLSAVAVALAFTDISTQNLVDVPSVNLKINGGWLSGGLAIAIAYVLVGVYMDVRSIIERHSEALKTIGGVSFEKRYSDLADKLSEIVSDITPYRGGDYGEKINSILRNLRDYAEKTRMRAGDTVDVITNHAQERSTVLNSEAITKINIIRSEADTFFGNIDQEVRAIGEESSSIKHDLAVINNFKSDVESLSSEVRSVGQSLSRIGDEYSKKQRDNFLYYDVSSSYVIGLVGLSSSLVTASRLIFSA